MGMTTNFIDTVHILHLAVYSFFYVFGRMWLPLKSSTSLDAMHIFMRIVMHIQEYANLNSDQLVQKLFPPNIVPAKYNMFTVLHRNVISLL